MSTAPDDFSLHGRTVLITGGAGILGTRITEALLRHGAKVAVVDADDSRLATIRRTHPDSAMRTFNADITQRASLEALRAEVESTLGPVDVLLNNAAAKSPNFFEPFASFPVEDWDQVLRVNLTGAMLACQVFGTPMAERGRGSIVNTLSVYGIVAPDQRIYEGSMYEGRAINTPAVYSASKAGLWGLTQYLASYWGARGVRVNAVTPGGVFSGQNDTFQQRYGARVPLGRMARSDELTGAFVFLASDASTYVTGHNLMVDGGLTVW